MIINRYRPYLVKWHIEPRGARALLSGVETVVGYTAEDAIEHARMKVIWAHFLNQPAPEIVVTEVIEAKR